MGLLLPEEHIIFMEMCTKYEEPAIRLPAEDIKKLVDAGIRTCMSFGTFWDWIEPQKGVYDWSYYDDRIKLLNDCGMKVILHAQTYFPNWMPEKWLVKDHLGRTQMMPSPWNEEAWQYCLDFYKMVRDRYSSAGNLVACSWLTDGESLFPDPLCCFDDHARTAFAQKYGGLPKEKEENTKQFMLDAYTKVFFELQSILCENEYKEIWTCIHPLLKWHSGQSTDTIHSILSTFKATHPDTTINHLYCTWIQWTDHFKFFNAWGEEFGNVFGGAEYATGVVNNSRIAIKNKLRGLLLGCVHPSTGHRRIEDWMLQNIKDALTLWK